MRPVRTSAVFIFVLSTLSPVLDGQSPDIPALVDRATQLLLSSDDSNDQGAKGLVALLDAITAAAPAAGLSGACQTGLATAQRLAAGDPSGVDEMVVLLGGCYREAHGKSFSMPPAVRSMPDLLEHARGLLASVRGLIQQGRPDEAIRRMLEVAMMVVTPIPDGPLERPGAGA